MDALARLAPVARPLLTEVDAALLGLGVPGTHPVLRLLGGVGSTPATVVESVADLDPERLRSTAAMLRDQAEMYAQAPIPTGVPAQGAAAAHMAVIAAALRDHVAGPESLAERLRTLASFVEGVADWQQLVRDELARMLHRVMTSQEAVTLRLHRVEHASGDALTATVLAAAEIGAALLGVVQRATVAGRDHLRDSEGLAELAYRPPAVPDPVGYQGPIRIF